MPSKTRVVVYVVGGVVDEVVSDVPIDVVLVDFDTENYEVEPIREVDVFDSNDKNIGTEKAAVIHFREQARIVPSDIIDYYFRISDL